MDPDMRKGNFPLRAIVLIVGIGLLNAGTLLKKENPIRRTQTDPIKYEDKMKELGGKAPKGAPRPSFEYYFRRLFLTDFPFFKKKEEPGEVLHLEDSKELTETWVESEDDPKTAESEADWWFEQRDNKDNN